MAFTVFQVALGGAVGSVLRYLTNVAVMRGIGPGFPWATVVVNIAGDSRFVRASMLDTLSQDFVRTAKAKGLPGRVVTYKHAMRNAMLPVVTNIGLEIPFLFTGAIVTETIFSWPGIGKLTIDATRTFDYPILMGVLLVTSVLVVLANLLADIAYGVIDPRIKY